MTAIIHTLMRQFRCYFCLIIGILLNQAFAASTVLLTDATNESESTALIPYMEFIEDAGGKLSIKDLLSNNDAFSAPTEPFVNIGFGQNHRWLRLTLNNQSREKQWYLEVGGSITSQVEVFTKGDNLYTKQEEMARSIAHRYRLILEPNAETTLYIKVYDPKGVALLSPTLFSSSQMIDSISYRHAFYAFLMSGLLTLTAYNFLYFLYLRDTVFLTLSVCIVAYAISMGNNIGLLHFFPWFADNLHWNNGTFLFLVIITGHHLALRLLDVRRQLPSMVV